MKIAIFSQHFWPEKFRINEVVNELVSQNHEVCVVTGLPNYPSGKIEKEYKSLKTKISFYKKIKIIRIPIIPRLNGNGMNLFINYLSFIISGLINLRFIKKNIDSDVIFIYGTSPILQAIPAIFLSKITNLPTILWVQDLWPESISDTGFIKNKFFLKFISIFVRYVYKNSHKILLQSPKFMNHYNITPFKEKCEVHYNPCEYKVSEKISNKSQKNDIFEMIYSGNIGKAQNLDFIFDLASYIIKKNYKVKIILIGNGSEKNNIEKKINLKKFNNIINIYKYKSKDNLKETLNKCDSLIISLNDGSVLSKTIPAKFQTYLFFSKPIFSLSSGIVNNLVVDNNLGFAARHDQKEKILENFKKLIFLSKEEKYIIGENCFKFFQENFEIEKNCNKLIQIFKKEVN